MGIDNLTHVKKGERLTAYTVNALIDGVKGVETPGNFKPGKGIRAQTLFYTEEAIPPYSIFPLIADATDTKDTFYAKYTVEKYDKDNASSYLPGYFGTNGRLSIAAGTTFFGWIIDKEWDSPIKISDFATGKEKCGFQDNSWEATVEADGLIINGSAPQDSDAYYCRLENISDPLKVASKMPNTDTRPEGAFTLSSTGTWVYANSLDSFAKQNDSAPPAVANPCGYPPDRPVFVGKAEGFPKYENQNNSGSSSSSSSPEIDLVAVACDVREFFVINAGNNGTQTPVNDTTIFKKGSLHYIYWNNGRWVPHPDNEASSSSTLLQRPSGARLVVCQRDMPDNWSKEFLMPFYTPESNMGVSPAFSNSISFSTANRCGVKPGEHTFTDKFCDYCVTNGTYEYNPQFTANVTVDGTTGGNNTVYADVCGQQWEVIFPNSNAGLSGSSYPDVYPYDQILVVIDCEGGQCWAVDYPTDYPEGTIMPWFRPNPWTSPIPHYAGRGWVQYIPIGGQGIITAVNIDKTSSYYDSSGDCVWVEAGTNDKIQVKEGSLCFIEKVKTNAIV